LNDLARLEERYRDVLFYSRALIVLGGFAVIVFGSEDMCLIRIVNLILRPVWVIVLVGRGFFLCLDLGRGSEEDGGEDGEGVSIFYLLLEVKIRI
jgi:hypothetical protein